MFSEDISGEGAVAEEKIVPYCNRVVDNALLRHDFSAVWFQRGCGTCS